MPRLTIRLVTNPETGKRSVDIAYESDPDALAQEHEQEHRALVDKLVGSVSSGAIDVERVSGAGSTGTPLDATGAEQAPREKLRQ
jgi:hypothetical protein